MRSRRASYRNLLAVPLVAAALYRAAGVANRRQAGLAAAESAPLPLAAAVAPAAVASADAAPAADADAAALVTVPGFKATRLCELEDPRIDESSGIAASRRYPGCLWTHNDSGDSARLFLINLQGKTLAQVTLAGAQAQDWEDMAVAGSAAGGSGTGGSGTGGNQDAWVYVGDIGDNVEARPGVTIYRFRERAVNVPGISGDVAGGAAGDGKAPDLTVACERMSLTYPDGAHNAETLLATNAGHLIIVTKGLGESKIFRTPRPFTAGGTQQMRRIGSYTFGKDLRGVLATGGDLSPDGQRIVICTYSQVHEWTLPIANSNLSPLLGVWQTKPRSFPLPKAKQAEAICYSADGSRLYLTSEQRPTPLYELVIGE